MPNVKSFVIQPGEFLTTGKVVNKFLPLERALNLLNSRKMWFANPREWTDPFERRFIDASYAGGAKFAWKDRVLYIVLVLQIMRQARPLGMHMRRVIFA